MYIYIHFDWEIASIYIYIYVCINKYIYVYLYTYIQTFCSKHSFLPLDIFISVYMYIDMYKCIYVYICIHINTPFAWSMASFHLTGSCIQVYIYIHIYIYGFTHTYIYINKYISHPLSKMCICTECIHTFCLKHGFLPLHRILSDRQCLLLEP
jgi:hypothetical protein